MLDPRGIVTAVFAGQSFDLKLSFASLIDAQKTLGCEVTTLLERLSTRDVRILDIAVILRAAMIGGKMANPPSLDDVGNLMLQAGLAAVLPIYSEILTNTLTAGAKPKEASDGVPGEATPTPSPSP